MDVSSNMWISTFDCLKSLYKICLFIEYLYLSRNILIAMLWFYWNKNVCIMHYSVVSWSACAVNSLTVSQLPLRNNEVHRKLYIQQEAKYRWTWYQSRNGKRISKICCKWYYYYNYVIIIIHGIIYFNLLIMIITQICTHFHKVTEPKVREVCALHEGLS